MEEIKYEVRINGVVYASNMNIQTAAILVKGLFDEYYLDEQMEVTVCREVKK